MSQVSWYYPTKPNKKIDYKSITCYECGQSFFLDGPRKTPYVRDKTSCPSCEYRPKLADEDKKDEERKDSVPCPVCDVQIEISPEIDEGQIIRCHREHRLILDRDDGLSLAPVVNLRRITALMDNMGMTIELGKKKPE